jgi:hypothetical protein
VEPTVSALGIEDLVAQLVAFALTLGFAWLLGVANREESRPGFFGLAQWLVLGILALLSGAMLLHGELLGAPVLAMTAILAWPWAFARRWLIPRGHWRTAYWLVRSSAWTWHDDNKGGALVAAAWAAVRAGGPSRALAFVEARCERSDCGAAHLLATGLVAAARGDDAAARRWIGSLCEFEGAAAPRMARRLAVQWCAAEATTRGAWSTVARLAGDPDADAATAMLSVIGRRMIGAAPIPDDAELERAWQRVPDRAAWRPLVDRARAHRPAEPTAAPAAPAEVEADVHRAALVLHARLLGHARPTAAEVAATARAWDRAFGDARFADGVRRRTAAVGARADALTGLRARVEADLVEVVRTTGVALGEDPDRVHDTLGRVRSALHQALLDELEIVADGLATRVRARRALPLHEEWREYLALRGAFTAAVEQTGPNLQRLGYAIVNPAICALGVWLWNDRKNRVHANQMFRWLLREAEIAGDAEAVALHRRNVDCGR